LNAVIIVLTMARTESEYDRWEKAPSVQIANEIASLAHERVYGVFEPLLFDQSLPESVRGVINDAFHRVANRALTRKQQRNQAP